MTLITWRKDFETGIPDVDHEHREIVDLINGLHDSIADGAGKDHVEAFLGEVFARIAAHFALEESMMRKHRYDEYAAHKEEHEDLLDGIRDIMDTVASGTGGDYRASLSAAVHDWFVDHFKSKDARLHRKLGI